MTSSMTEGVCVVLDNYGNHANVTTRVRPLPPLPESNQLQIQMHAFGLNFADLYAMRGLFRTAVTPALPFIVGREGAGQIVKVGSDVKGFEVGDRVACICPNLGVWAEYINVSPNQCIRLPQEMSYIDGAAFFINYLTAYCSLFNFGCLSPGSKVFVHSVAGGVGCAAIQLVKTAPDTKIIGTASKSKHDKMRELGVDLIIDSEDPNYVEKVLDKFPKGVDIVLDNRSGADFGKAQKMLGQMGKIVHVGANNVLQEGWAPATLKTIITWWNTKNVGVFDLVAANQSVCGFHLDNLHEKDEAKFFWAASELKKLYVKGLLKPKIDRIFEMEKASDALKYFEERKSIGKVVIVVKAK